MFALVACDKPASTDPKVDDPAKNTTTTNGTPTTPTIAPTIAPAPMPAAVAVDDSILSTPADFEESAEKAITAKTYKAELATLETDLAKD
jgi:hypothetical protein